MIRIGKGLFIHYSVFLVFLISLLAKTFSVTFIAFLCALCHELSHLLFALCLKEKCRGIGIMPYGCKVFLGRIGSYKNEFLISAAGPLFNLIMLFLIKKGPFFDANLAMLCINLFPIMPLDGGRMAFALISLKKGPFYALGIMKKASLFFGGVLILAGIYQAIFCGFNLSVLTAGSFLLLGAIGDKRKVNILTELLEPVEKKLSTGFREGRILASGEGSFIRSLVYDLAGEKYSLVAVLSREGEVLGLLSEEKIIAELKKDGITKKLGDILEK